MHNPDRHGRKRRKKYFVFASFLFITFFGEGGWGVLRFKKDEDTRREFWRESLRGRGLKIYSPVRGINSRTTVTLPLRRLPPYFLHTGPPGINPLEGAQWFFTPNRTCYLLFFLSWQWPFEYVLLMFCRYKVVEVPDFMQERKSTLWHPQERRWNSGGACHTEPRTSSLPWVAFVGRETERLEVCLI